MTYQHGKPLRPIGPIWRIYAYGLGLVLLAFGSVLTAGGLYLIMLAGSWYYALAGAGLLGTAYLLFRLKSDVLMFYGFVWSFTVIWAFWEVGFDWWDQVPRLVAPTVVLALVAILAPALRRNENTGARQ